MDDRSGSEPKLARMRVNSQPQPRLSSPSSAVSKLHPYQIALSRPSLSRYSPSSFKGAPDGDHAATGFGSSVQHRQIHTSEGLLNRIKPRMEHRQSIDSNTRSCRPPGSPASPKSSTREQLAAALEKAVKACAAENPHSEASPSAKGPSRFLRSKVVSRGGSPRWTRESVERTTAATDRSQSPGQQHPAVRSTRLTRENTMESTVVGRSGRGGSGDAADQLCSLQICPQTSRGSQSSAQVIKPRAATDSELQVRATTPDGASKKSHALLRRANNSWAESAEKPSTPDGSKPVVRVGKTIVPSFNGRYPPQPDASAGLQSAGEGRSHVLTVHGNDINSSVHSTFRSTPISNRARTPENRMMRRSSEYSHGDSKGVIQGALTSAQHSMHRPTHRKSPQCAAPIAPARRSADRDVDSISGPSKAESRWTHKVGSGDQSKMAPLQFNSQGVAVVAIIPDTRSWDAQASTGICEEPQEADPGVNGLSLLEYMDLIASEDTAANDGGSADGPWASKFFGTDTEACTKNELPERHAHGDNEHHGSGASDCEASAQEVPQTPSARGGVDLPTRADSNGSRRHDGVLCQPLANRFSNLPDVELRPGTAACHAFGGDADSCEHGPRSSRLSNHDPAFSVTHVSLADMAPNLFTAKDHEPVSSTPRCQRSTAPSSAAIDGGYADNAALKWAHIGSEWQKQSHGGEASEDEPADSADQPGAHADAKQKPGTRLVQSARPMSPNELVLDETVWTKQALKRPPSRQKPPPEALHLFSEGGAVWKSHGGVRRPQTAMGLSHRCSVVSGQSLPAVIPLTATARPISRHRPPPESLDCFTEVTQRLCA